MLLYSQNSIFPGIGAPALFSFKPLLQWRLFKHAFAVELILEQFLYILHRSIMIYNMIRTKNFDIKNHVSFMV